MLSHVSLDARNRTTLCQEASCPAVHNCSVECRQQSRPQLMGVWQSDSVHRQLTTNPNTIPPTIRNGLYLDDLRRRRDLEKSHHFVGVLLEVL